VSGAGPANERRTLGRLRLLVNLAAVGLGEAKRGGTSGLHLSSFLRPLSVWLKWGIAGAPTSKIPCCTDRLSLLEFASLSAPTAGLWLEFGVWKGESLRHLAHLTKNTVHGFDSFKGLPLGWTPGLKRGAFSTGGILPRVPGNVVIVQGLFQDTLPRFLAENPGVAAFVHVDSDLYESARYVLSELRPRLSRGTVIVFDEYAELMPDDEARAFREFVRSTGTTFRFLGYSAIGSVAVEIT
jgi:hypothetical protein